MDCLKLLLCLLDIGKKGWKRVKELEDLSGWVFAAWSS